MDITQRADAIEFAVRVIPRSSRSEIVGEFAGAVRVRLTSPPVGGAANAELVNLFAKKLRVSRSSVVILRGETSRTKQLQLIGVTAAEFRRAIE